MPGPLVARARVFVDARAGALKESGDILLPIRDGLVNESHIAGELGELILGHVEGRRTADEITIFKSLGMAVEDVVAAELVLARAIERGLGRTWSVS
jgi:ornithine cyclodeaminase/alanine dehydrogenase-like protein (mu-crystallin family)